MIITHEYYTASKDGKQLRIPGVPDDVTAGVVNAYRQAGYIVTMVTEQYETGGSE